VDRRIEVSTEVGLPFAGAATFSGCVTQIQ
jgi:hypothetical protein